MSFKSKEEDADKADKEEVGPINHLPSEMLLIIFRYLPVDVITHVVRNTCTGWRELASNPSLLRNRSIYYSPDHVDIFVESVKFCTEVEVLDLGDHIELHRSATAAVLQAPIAKVRNLQFSSSCRTSPEHVNAILNKFKNSIESLTLCLNDEVASYGNDGGTCYSLTIQRPGMLFNILGQFENLNYLKLRGGCSHIWFCNTIGSWRGLNKLEVLDLSELEEIRQAQESASSLSATLISRNSDHLKSLYLPSVGGAPAETKQATIKCKRTIHTLGLHSDDLEELLGNLPNVTSVVIGGRYLLQENRFKEINTFFRVNQVLHYLTQLTLVQVCDTLNLLLPAIADNCPFLKIFRSEGNTLSGEGLAHFIISMPQLEELYLSYTDALEEHHLVLAQSHLHNLKILDITGIGFKDCMLVVRNLRDHLSQGLKIHGTACDCSFSVNLNCCFNQGNQ